MSSEQCFSIFQILVCYPNIIIYTPVSNKHSLSWKFLIIGKENHRHLKLYRIFKMHKHRLKNIIFPKGILTLPHNMTDHLGEKKSLIYKK